MPLVEKSTLTASLKFQMMTTTFVSGIIMILFSLLVVSTVSPGGFVMVLTPVNREPTPMLFTFLANLGCSVIVL